MSVDREFNGSDNLMLGFDYELRRQGYAGNSCQIILELAAPIAPEKLRERLALLISRYPILTARPAGIFVLKWKSQADQKDFPRVRVHVEKPGLREQLADESLAVRCGELIRFDLIARADGRMDVLFTWAHVLMDANSAEHFLAVVGRDDVPLPAVDPVLPQRPKKPFKDRLLLTRKSKQQLDEFCKAPPRTVGVRFPAARKVQRYRVERFSKEETALVRANAAKLCGALAGAQFHAAVAMMELHRLHDRIGQPSPSYVLPVPVSLRAKGSVEPLFCNQITMLMAQLLPTHLATAAQTVTALKTQMAQGLRDGLIESGVTIAEISRGLPFWLYLRILKYGLRGEICSFFYGDTAAVSPLLNSFFGATINEFTHIGATTPSPGIGAIFYYFGGNLRVTVFHLATHFSTSEAEDFAVNLRARLLNP